ncbi:MAG: type II secretion system protein [Bdellovibrionales bacterium]
MVVGIIGILAAVGIPLYRAQQDTALAAVQKNNAYSVQKFIDNLRALGKDVTAAKLGDQIKVKGKLLPNDCFTINAKQAAGSSGVPATTIDSSSTVTELWAVDIKYKTTSCEELEAKYNVCIDSAGNIKDASSPAANGICVGTDIE